MLPHCMIFQLQTYINALLRETYSSLLEVVVPIKRTEIFLHNDFFVFYKILIQIS